MNKKKKIKLALLLGCVFAFILLLTTPALADVGNSFSGGGGSSHSGGSSSSGSGLGMFLILADNPIIAIIVVIAVIVYVIYTKNKGGATTSYSDPGFKPSNGINEDSVVEEIKAIDPDFSKEHFKNYVGEMWLALQEAWEAKNWQIVRPFESNALFNVHNKQLQEYIDMHRTNYMNMQNIRSTTIASFRVDNEYEVVCVKLDASLLDYVVDDESGKVIEGSKTNYVHRSYRLELIRKKGIKTNTQQETSVTNCPNCGAPTQVTSSGQCEYCKSVITTGDYGWVLNKYGPWN